MGFIICYGAIILKLYRHLVEFRTRKAHRWVLRDVDLLKYLATMVFAVLCYMAAFTASSYDLIKTADLDGLQEVNTNTCQPLKWEFVTQTSEILILAFGLHLAIASRNANTQFRVSEYSETRGRVVMTGCAGVCPIVGFLNDDHINYARVSCRNGNFSSPPY